VDPATSRSPRDAVRVADEFFRIAHRDRTGRARLHPRAAGLGLAAGLLAELAVGRWLEVDGRGRLSVVRRDPPADALAHTTLDQLLAQPGHRDVRTWLAFLEPGAVDAVGQRLTRAGHVRQVKHRRLWTSRTVYVPVDRNAAAWPEIRLARLLVNRDRLAEPDAVLAGLVAVTGLSRHVLWEPDTHDPGMTHLTRVVTRLRPSLHHLIAHTEAAVGDAVLAPR
jgi:hypothetical protein